MKVFITGATGYVGFNVASAFRRAGHEVWGLVRSEEKARKLIQHEIHPVIGSMQKPESYEKRAEECSVLVHTASEMNGDMVDLDQRTVETFLHASKAGVRPKTVIYTSGVWVHGTTGDRLVDETSPLSPARLVAWRPSHELMVLEAKGLKGIVIRPGVVYGRQGGLTSARFFEGAYRQRELKVVGDGTNRWSMVHVDDLARGYVLAAMSGLVGDIFNLCDSSRSTVTEMAGAAARAAGYLGKIQYIPLEDAKREMGAYAECLALDQHVDNSKALRLLSWTPLHQSFVDGIETYFASWKAWQEQLKRIEAKAA
jgi:nucleoside-diphosphate-sugar epimerase